MVRPRCRSRCGFGVEERTFLRRKLARQLVDRLFEIGIVAGQAQRRAILRERLGESAAPVEHLRQTAHGGEVFRRAFQDDLELGSRRLELVQLEERAPEGHPCGQISGMDRQSGAADLDRILVVPRPPVLLGELGKSNRRRILLDPAPQFVNA